MTWLAYELSWVIWCADVHHPSVYSCVLLCVLCPQVHDMLVGEQGVDPTSPLYYTAIESHVAAAFPDKWAHWQQVMALGKGPTKSLIHLQT